jgi:PAS domain S-box-containing protein
MVIAVFLLGLACGLAVAIAICRWQRMVPASSLTALMKTPAFQEFIDAIPWHILVIKNQREQTLAANRAFIIANGSGSDANSADDTVESCICPPEDQERLERAFSTACTSGVPDTVDIRHRPHGDPSIPFHWHRVHIHPISSRDDAKSSPILVLTGIDIHDQRQTQAALEQAVSARATELQASQQHLAAIVKTVDEGLILCDHQGIILHANPAISRIMGCDHDQLLGQHVSCLMQGILHPDGSTMASTELPLAAILAGGQPEHNVVFGIPQPGGKVIWLTMNVVPIHHPDGSLSRVVSTWTDITERKRIEDDLIASRERLASILNTVASGITLRNADGIVLEWNHAMEQMFDIPRSEVIGQDHSHHHYLRLLDASGQPLALGDLPSSQTLRTGVSLHRTIVGRICANGSKRWFAANSEPLRDSSGRLVGAVSSYTDITDQLASERKLRVILDTIPDAILVCDTQRVVLANAAAERMYDYESGRLVGTPWRNLLAPGVNTNHIAMKDAIHQGESAGSTTPYEVAMQRRDGIIIPVELVTTALDLPDGRFSVCACRDISERRRREQDLRDSEERLRMAFEYSGTGMGIFSLDLIPLRLNNALSSILGYTREELMGMRIPQVTHPDDLHVTADLYQDLRDGRRTFFQIEKRYIHRNGSVLYCHLTAALMRDEQGRPLQFIAQLQDITERHRMERELREAHDQALALARMKSEFLATISHELRTPMSGVLGLTQLLLLSDLTPDQEENARAVLRCGESLLTIINDVLDSAKFEAGQMVANIIDFNPALLIEDVAALLAPSAHAKGLELIADVDPALDGSFRCDPGRIRQMLVNLVGNAIKFTATGEIQITAELVPVPGQPANLVMTIRDTGIGITADLRPRLFQPFTQGDSSIARAYSGTGLGLAITQQLVLLLGGRITVDSTPGEGASFQITLPLDAGSDAILPTAQLPADPPIIIVSANPHQRHAFDRQCRALGLTTVLADSATTTIDAALAMAARGVLPRTILVDDQMPGGCDSVTSQIASHSSIASIRIIRLVPTGTSPIRCGATHCTCVTLVKPMRRTQLMREIRSLGQRPRMLDRALRLMIVDDNPTNRQVASFVLENLGHTVISAANGDEALRMLANDPYDVVLMDGQMPGCDGYTATRRIRSGIIPGIDPHIPVIALTAYTQFSDRERGLAAGMDDIVAKPIDLSVLRQAFARCGLSLGNPAISNDD